MKFHTVQYIFAVSNLILIPSNRQNKLMGLFFSKDGQEGILKSWYGYMQTNAHIFNLFLLPLCCFLYVQANIRPAKTCRRTKTRNAWAYKRVGLWTGKTQISKVKSRKKKLKLLCTKKVRHNVFNLSTGGSVTWIVNF